MTGTTHNAKENKVKTWQELGKVIIERDEFGIRLHSLSIFKTNNGKEYWFYDASLGVAMPVSRTAAKRIASSILARNFQIR